MQDVEGKVRASGFCARTAQYTARVKAEGIRPDRVQGKLHSWLTVHLQRCVQCRCAMRWKDIEHQTAVRMGPDAVAAFDNGFDISKMEGFDSAVSAVLKREMAEGKISREMIELCVRMNEERNKICPTTD